MRYKIDLKRGVAFFADVLRLGLFTEEQSKILVHVVKTVVFRLQVSRAHTHTH